MKDEPLENSLIYLYEKGTSVRELSKKFKVSRRRIRRILTENEKRRESGTDNLTLSVVSRKSKLDPYKLQISDLLKEHKDITNERILEIIKEDGYTGKRSILQAYMQKIRDKKVSIIQCTETFAGQRASHDWSEYIVSFTDSTAKKIIIFSIILNYSRRQYIEVVADKTQNTLFECLIHSFDYFQGVPSEIKSDNQKACVDRWEYGQPIYNRNYLLFASHYKFTPLTITPGRPVENLKIERPFYYFELSFLNGRLFRNEEDFKRQLSIWLTEVNDLRIHRTTNRKPLELYLEEQPFLTPLPMVHYDTSILEYRVVNRESCIQWQNYYYYVPDNYIFKSCPVRVTNTSITIYSPDHKRLISHPLAIMGQKEKYIGVTKKQLGAKPKVKIDDVKSQLYQMGEPIIAYTNILLKLKKSSSLIDLLSLTVIYHKSDIIKAVQRAIDYGTYELRCLKNFLKLHATPKDNFKSLFNNTKHE
jgi:transposase